MKQKKSSLQKNSSGLKDNQSAISETQSQQSSPDLSAFRNVLVNPEMANPADILRLQSLAGNKATSEWLKNQNQDETSDQDNQDKLAPSITNEIHSERGKGMALDGKKKKNLEKEFDSDFSNVRLHTGTKADSLNQKLKSKAFTSGSDIFFRESTDTRNSQILRHELSHVVQQGGRASTGDLFLGKADTAEERQAENFSKTHSGFEMQTDGSGQSGLSPFVQRLMDVKTFKSKTNERFATRSKSTIIEIDAALGKIPPGDDIYSNRALYTDLYSLCKTFLTNTDENSEKRKQGVTLLKQEIEKEVKDRVTKFTEVIQGFVSTEQDGFSKKAVELDKLGIFIDHFKGSIDLAGSEKNKSDELSGMSDSLNQRIDDLLGDLESMNFDTSEFSLIQEKIDNTSRWIEVKKNVLNQDAAADESRLKLLKQKLIQKDLDELETIKNNPDTPDETRSFLDEILANKDKIFFEGGASGAKKKDVGGKQYLLKHNIADKTMDKGERLGSLAHELTHVSVAEKFDNSVLLFSYAKTADPEDVKKLIKKRVENITQAVTLANNCPQLKNGDRKKLGIVKGKLDYAGSDKVGLYINRFAETNELSKVEAEELRDKLKTLGLNNTVIEYDSVVNQILTYLAVWSVPKTDPFYVYMVKIGKQANLHRTT